MRMVEGIRGWGSQTSSGVSEAAVEGRPWGRKRVEAVPKVQKVRSALSIYVGVGCFWRRSAWRRSGRGDCGGVRWRAVAGENVDGGEEGVESAGVGDGADARAEEGGLAGRCGKVYGL